MITVEIIGGAGIMIANYCIKCGRRIFGQKKCPFCGEPAASFTLPALSENKEADKQNGQEFVSFETVTIDDIWNNSKKENHVSKKRRWCPECYSQVPNGAKTCPHCGHIMED